MNVSEDGWMFVQKLLDGFELIWHRDRLYSGITHRLLFISICFSCMIIFNFHAGGSAGKASYL